jgi:hypothetical protein
MKTATKKDKIKRLVMDESRWMVNFGRFTAKDVVDSSEKRNKEEEEHVDPLFSFSLSTRSSIPLVEQQSRRMDFSLELK